MISGIAGGIQPRWHYVADYHEDCRIYNTPGPVMRWAKQNEQFLVGPPADCKRRRIVVAAEYGLLWPERGRGPGGRSVHGIHACARPRSYRPYLPVHVDDLATTTGLSCIVLPDLRGLSDQQCASVREFASRGGSVITTGVTSLYDEWGDPRADYALADLFGASRTTPALKLSTAGRRARPAQVQQTASRRTVIPTCNSFRDARECLRAESRR
jgi:hypothetical protein